MSELRDFARAGMMDPCKIPAAHMRIEYSFHEGFLYLMYSRDHGVTKLGYSDMPRERLRRTRKERRDSSIDLVAFWGVHGCGPFGSIQRVESFFHETLAPLCTKHPTQWGLGEWYDIYWPNLAAHVESIGAMLGVVNVLLARGRL